MNYINNERDYPEPVKESHSLVKVKNGYLNSEVHSSNKVPPLVHQIAAVNSHFDSQMSSFNRREAKFGSSHVSVDKQSSL